MDHLRKTVFLATFVAILLTGCHRQTTVILPPETEPDAPIVTTAPTEDETIPPATVPVTEPPTESVAEATEPPTELTEPPVTEPPVTEHVDIPTDPPATEPISVPVTDPPAEQTDAPEEPGLSDHPIGSIEWEILAEMNSRRAAQSLSMDHPLCAIAAIRAGECAQTLSPTRPDGRDWSSVLTDHDYGNWNFCGEIRLYCSQGLPPSILVDTWFSTDSTQSQILSGDYQYCGIGVSYQGSSMYIVVLFTG